MKRIFLRKSFSSFAAVCLVLAFTLTLAACGSKQAPAASTVKIVDMAGRNITIPSQVNKVYSVSPVGTIFMYTLDPDKIAGLNYELSEGEKKYTKESFHKLPLLSGNFGHGQTMNKEEVLKVKPDIILNMGDLTQTAISDADKMQEQLGIPVVLVTGDLDKTDKAYEFVGKITGTSERAKKLGDYSRKTFTEVKEKAAKIPEDKRVRVYYAEGNMGLQTDPKGSVHSELLEVVGGINVADVKVQQGYGRSEVSMEQLLKWNPEVVITCFDHGAANMTANNYDQIYADPVWSKIKAVQDKKVYQIPYLPNNWFDRPPGVNRIIGIKWLANLLYPNEFKLDLKTEVSNFYELFYQRKLTDQEYEEITAHAE